MALSGDADHEASEEDEPDGSEEGIDPERSSFKLRSNFTHSIQESKSLKLHCSPAGR